MSLDSSSGESGASASDQNLDSSIDDATGPTSEEPPDVPRSSTSDEVRRRAAHSQDGKLRRIRFWNEWGHPWPLWEEGPLGPDDLNLTESLSARLALWHQLWEQVQDPKFTWTHPGIGDQWEQAGELLFDELQLEVWDQAIVIPCHRAGMRREGS